MVNEKKSGDNRSILKKQQLLQLVWWLIIIILTGYLSSFFFFRLDLTSEKRYTLSPKSKEILRQLDDVVYIKLYLDGEIPVGFLKLKKSVIEMMDEFRAYAPGYIEYEIVDPTAIPDQKSRNEFFRQLYQKGLDPVNLQVKEKTGASSQQIIWPCMTMNYKGRELPLNLLANIPGLAHEANLNISEQLLEYNLINTIKLITGSHRRHIAFIEGHGEYDKLEVGDIAQHLSSFYELSRVRLNEYLWALRDSAGNNRFDCIVIAGPDSTFSERDKFIIDQFIMNGGNSFWLVDFIKVNMDSLAFSNATMGMFNNINIHDQLFKYGARVNPYIIQDLQCTTVPVNTALPGQEPQYVPAPWPYFPLLLPSSGHPVTRNLNFIKGEFVSSIDTVGEDQRVKKTFLLATSDYTKVMPAPVRVSLDMIGKEPDLRQFVRKNVPVAVLLEGPFTSLFENRLENSFAANPYIRFIPKGKGAKMIVVADGAVIRNQVKKVGKKVYPYPLGYDKFTNQTYGNKEFITNCINYLVDDTGIMELRARELKIRLLDKALILKYRTEIQVINVVAPLLIVALGGLLYVFFRNKKYKRSRTAV